MFITDSERLKEYTTENRIWQGIPGIEVTKKGRIFSTFYSGGVKEGLGNYSMLLMSDDGVNFSEPIAVAFDEKHRCFDPCLWIDPLDRLWFIWSVMPDDDVYAVICDDPDAEEIIWNEPRVIGKGVMLNKPTVLSTGEWLFPIAVWSAEVKKEVDNNAFAAEINSVDTGAFAYKSIDNGKSFEKIGGVAIKHRSYDEHMFLEAENECIRNYIRTYYGIGVSNSYDGGKTWTTGEDSLLGGPCSRFYIGKLKSGRVLLVNHYEWRGRNNLTAFLSEDGGNTFKYRLMLDERYEVSYPDVKETDDGYIYITYDRERGGFKQSMSEVYESAREILYAKITEDDIINGKIVNPNSKLRCIISKLGRYKYEDRNLFKEPIKYTTKEFAKYLINKHSDDVLGELFDVYSINCINMHKLENQKLDALVEKLGENPDNKEDIIIDIINLVKAVSEIKIDDFPIAEKVISVIKEELKCDLSMQELADRVGVSQYYMMHRFKDVTGVSVNKYRSAMRIACAKRLLVSTNKSITQIAMECGFNSMAYFADRFIRSEKVSPSEYRELREKV